MGLALAGQALIDLRPMANAPQTSFSPQVSLIFYALAIVLFTATAWPVPNQSVDWPDDGSSPGPPPRRAWVTLGVCLLVALAGTAYACSQVWRDYFSPTALPAWAAAMLALVVAGVALHPYIGWPARWGACSGPKTARARWLIVAAVAAVLATAALARFLWLDRVPLGLNADEGDQAALAIQLIRNQVRRGLWDYGWYRIHMLYFNFVALWLQTVGIGYVQSRMLNALIGTIGVGVVAWLGVRNFGPRIGLATAALSAVLAVYLQFSRITGIAAPTAVLWTLGLAFFLEAARRGRAWAWIGSGLAGGLSIYFYPSGRLWAVFSIVFVVYLLVHGLGGRRWGIVFGAALSAFSAIVATAPFLVLSYRAPEVLTLRAQETSIFTQDNVTRLPWWKPGMSLPSLLFEQFNHAFGILNQYGDRGGVWPTEHAILTSGALAALTVLGIGWISLRWRDPRWIALSAYFWISLAGVIFTVETPNVHRMSTVVPVLAIFPVLVLDHLARRGEWVTSAFAAVRTLPTYRPRLATTGLAVAAVGGLMAAEVRYYFVDYAVMDRWWTATIQGTAVHEEGPGTLVVGVGRFFHYINAGWVRLLAYDVNRAELRWVGSELPLQIPPELDQSFVVYPRQATYFPYLRELYPKATIKPHSHRPEGVVFSMFHVRRGELAAHQGARAWLPDGTSTGVDALGAAPATLTSYPASVRWTAGLRAPRYWNYVFQVGPGPAKLNIDGMDVLTVPAGTGALSATVVLARGTHAIAYEGTIVVAGEPALFRWAEQPDGADTSPTTGVAWRAPASYELLSDVMEPRGLLGTVKVGTARPDQLRIDDALVGCCFTQQVRGDQPFSVTWRGTVIAPVAGSYPMTLLAFGVSDLKIDGQVVIHSEREGDDPVKGEVRLGAGPHEVELTARFADGPSDVEWAWTVPGREPSIVPPSALRPPRGSTVGPAAPQQQLGGRREAQPATEPFTYQK